MVVLRGGVFLVSKGHPQQTPNAPADGLRYGPVDHGRAVHENTQGSFSSGGGGESEPPSQQERENAQARMHVRVRVCVCVCVCVYLRACDGVSV